MKTQVINPATYTRNQQPGKFEGEQPATEYFWEALADGDGETVFASDFSEDEDTSEDWNNPTAEIFHINTEESEAFDLPINSVYMIREDSQGFVYGSNHASREEAEKAFRAWLGL